MLLADCLGRDLAERAHTDSRIWVLDGDLADSDGAHRFARQHPDRFLMAGIAEQNMVSMAAGMASAGVRPFVFSFAAFLCCRAYDQIRVGLSQAAQAVALVASHAGGLSGRNGKSHSILNDLAIISTLPDIRVFAPSDQADVALTLELILNSAAPSYTRLPRRQVAASDELGGRPEPCRWITQRRSVALLSCGVATLWAKEAIGFFGLSEDVGIVHCLELTDTLSLRAALEGVERVIVVEDHHPIGGLQSLLSSILPGRLAGAVSWPSSYMGCSGADAEVRAAYALMPEQIAQQVRMLIGRSFV
jgi:transketolase